MNKNKILIFILGLIAVYYIGITNKKSIFVNGLKTSSLQAFKNNLAPTEFSAEKSSRITQDKKNLKNKNIEKKATAQVLDSQVPWQELNEKWNEEVKNFLISTSDRNGPRMLKAFLEARSYNLLEEARLGEKYQKIQSSKPLDRLKEDQFAIESSDVFKKSTEVNKKIFGKYFDAVKSLHKEFEESIQVYSRDMPISLDFGFDG